MMLFTGMMHLTSKQMCIFSVGCIKHIIQLSKYNKWFMLEIEYAQAATKKHNRRKKSEQIGTAKRQSQWESSESTRKLEAKA